MNGELFYVEAWRHSCVCRDDKTACSRIVFDYVWFHYLQPQHYRTFYAQGSKANCKVLHATGLHAANWLFLAAKPARRQLISRLRWVPVSVTMSHQPHVWQTTPLTYCLELVLSSTYSCFLSKKPFCVLQVELTRATALRWNTILWVGHTFWCVNSKQMNASCTC